MLLSKGLWQQNIIIELAVSTIVKKPKHFVTQHLTLYKLCFIAAVVADNNSNNNKKKRTSFQVSGRLDCSKTCFTGLNSVLAG
jgi:hypothetical protein